MGLTEEQQAIEDRLEAGGGNVFDPADINHLIENDPQRTLTEDEAKDLIRNSGTNSSTALYDMSDSGLANILAGRASDQAREEGKEDFAFLQEQALAQAQAQREAVVGAARDIGDYNFERFPDIVERAGETAFDLAGQINEFVREQFEGAWDTLYPEWREDMVGAAGRAQADSVAITERFRSTVMPKLLDAADEMGMQAIRNVQSQLQGDIPADVEAQLRRRVAEMGNTLGLRGQDQGFLTARDLGLTSLDLQERGLANAGNALNITPGGYNLVNQTLQAPVVTGGAATNLIRGFMAPQADPAALAGNFVGNLLGLSSVTPTSVLQAGTQISNTQAQLVQGQLQFNTNRADENYWNQINLAGQRQAAAEAGQSGVSPASGAMAGAAIGTQIMPGWGTAIGAGVGAIASLI